MEFHFLFVDFIFLLCALALGRRAEVGLQLCEVTGQYLTHIFHIKMRTEDRKV